MLVWPDHRYLKVVSNKNRLRHPSPTFTHFRYSHNFEVPSFGLFQSQVITPTLNFLLKVWISNIGSSLICNFKASISFQLYFIIEQCCYWTMLLLPILYSQFCILNCRRNVKLTLVGIRELESSHFGQLETEFWIDQIDILSRMLKGYAIIHYFQISLVRIKENLIFHLQAWWPCLPGRLFLQHRRHPNGRWENKI